MANWYAVFDEGGTEDRRQGPSDGIAECEADGSGTGVGDPVALCYECSTSDAVGKVFEVWVGGEGFCRRGLMDRSALISMYESVRTYLSVIASLEEGRDADKANLVVPHHRELAVGRVVRYGEDVLEDCKFSMTAYDKEPDISGVNTHLRTHRAQSVQRSLSSRSDMVCASRSL